MADARNPLGGGSMDDLRRGLEGLAGELRSQLDQARKLEEAGGKRAKIEDRRVAREEQIARDRTAAAGRTASFESALETERRAVAERNIARAKRQQAEEAQRAARFLPRAGGTSQGYAGGLTPAEVRARAEMLGLQTGGASQGTGAGWRPGQGRPIGPVGQLPPPPLPYGVPREFLERMRRTTLPAAADAERAAQRRAYVEARPTPLTDADRPRRAAAAIRDLTAANDAAVPSWRRHGAMTSEFFEALGRGEVRLSELRWQLGITIAKFGGWLTAGAAVFAIVDALRELREGALGALDGVNKLQRIIPNLDREQAQTGLRDLAGQFNLPITDVAETAYGLSKVYGNLEDTLTATQSALFAVKVGELEAGQATKFLTSIIQGFQLDAGELPELFDTINQAQNRFGGNIAQIIQGVAGSAGAFQAVGGQYRELIALVQTGTRLTGRSGSELGTALRRSAEIITRPDRRTRLVDLLGIDPRDSSILEVYRAAMKAAAGATREEQVEIARALSTPELASGRILPIIRNPALFERIYEGLDPSKVKNSAANELERALQGPSEQISRVGIQLQQLGSSLAQGGFLDGLFLALKAVNGILSGANQLLNVFNSLPRPMRTLLALALEVAAVMRVLRFFNVGGRGNAVPALPYAPGAIPDSVPGGVIGPRMIGPQQPRHWQGRLGQFNRAVAGWSTAVAGAGATGRVLGGTMTRAASVTTRAVGAFTGAAGSAKKFATTPLGGMDSFFIAVTAGFLIVDAMKQQFDQTNNVLNELDRRAGSLDASQLRAQAEKLRNQKSIFDPALDVGADISRFLGFDNAEAPVEARRRAIEQLEREAETIESSQSKGVNLSQQQIRDRLDRRIAQARTDAGRSRAIALAQRELQNSLAASANASEEQRDAFAQTGDYIAAANADLARGVRSLQRALDALADVEEVQAYSVRLQNRVGAEGLTIENQRAIGGAIARARELYASTRNPEQRQKLLQEVETLENLAASNAQERLTRELGFARNANEQGAARDRYVRTIARTQIRGMEGRITRLQRRIRNHREELQTTQEGVEHFEALRDRANREGDHYSHQFGVPRIGQDLPDRSGGIDYKQANEMLQRSRKSARALRGQIRRENQQLEQLRKSLGLSREEFEALVQEQDRAQFQAELGEFDATTGRLQAQTANPLTAARRLVSRMRERTRRVQEAYRAHRTGFTEVEQQLQQESQALQQLANEELADFQSRQELNTARFSVGATDDQMLQRQLQDARDYAREVRSKGNKVDPKTLRDAMRRVYEAERAIAQQVRQRAQDLLSAQEAYALSRTDDPIKQAVIRAQYAARALSLARTPIEKLQARAELNNRRRDVRQTRQQEAYEQIEFEASIGKLERSAEIERLQALLKTIKGNRDLRRQIRQRIYQLQHEANGEVELDVGNIRLPTLYDVRRLARAGTNPPIQTNQTNVFHIDGSEDPEAVASAVVSRIELVGSTSMRSAQRAAGVR